eukprot:tig00000989_g6113.t1
MGERKVVNKYYPPDFDPEKLAKRKCPKNDQIKIRMMMPMSVQCTTCGEYIGAGKKFNSRKETVENDDYLGIKKHRLYMRCPRCSAEFTIKTDPKNSDYTAEHGIRRNFEPWKARSEEEERAKRQRADEEEGDAMKALENRTADSKREMDILEGLDEIRALNAANAAADADSLLEARRAAAEAQRRKEEEDDDRLARETFRRGRQPVLKVEAGDESDWSDGSDEEPASKKAKEAPETRASDGVGGAQGAPRALPNLTPAPRPRCPALSAAKAEAVDVEEAAAAVPLVVVKAKKKKGKEPAGLALLAAYASASDDDA